MNTRKVWSALVVLILLSAASRSIRPTYAHEITLPENDIQAFELSPSGEWTSGRMDTSRQDFRDSLPAKGFNTDHTGWTIEQLGPASTPFSSLTLDSEGRPAIIYEKDGNLTNIYKDFSGTWTSELVVSAVSLSHPPDSVRDSNGWTDVVYLDESSNEIRFAQKFKNWQGEWHWGLSPNPVARDVLEIFSTPLALGIGEYPNIGYASWDSKEVRIAYSYNDINWNSALVDHEYNISTETFIDLTADPDGCLHMVYYHDVLHKLVYVYRDGTGWYPDTVFDTLSDDHGLYPSIAVNPDSYKPSITYYNSTDQTLEFTSRPCGNPPDQFCPPEVIANLGDPGIYRDKLAHSLAVASDGTPLVAFYDFTNGDLKLATRIAVNQWSIQTIDAEGDGGAYPSLQLTSLGEAHISYYDQTHSSLKYAYQGTFPPPPPPVEYPVFVPLVAR